MVSKYTFFRKYPVFRFSTISVLLISLHTRTSSRKNTRLMNGTRYLFRRLIPLRTMQPGSRCPFNDTLRINLVQKEDAHFPELPVRPGNSHAGGVRPPLLYFSLIFALIFPVSMLFSQYFGPSSISETTWQWHWPCHTGTPS